VDLWVVAGIFRVRGRECRYPIRQAIIAQTAKTSGQNETK